MCAFPGCNGTFRKVSYFFDGIPSPRRLFCSTECREASRRIRKQAYKKRTKQSYRCRRASLGRVCAYPHCRVEEGIHINVWSDATLQCPSCQRQLSRVGSCNRCGGPRYHDQRTHEKYCPVCSPRTPRDDDIELTLVCDVTGKERTLVRRKGSILPDGSRAEREFTVLTVSPYVWAKNRV